MTWYGTDVTDFGDELIDLAHVHFNPDQPRDPHTGRWIKGGTEVTVAAVRQAVKPEWEYHGALKPKPFARQNRATRDALLAFSQKRIMDALTTPPSQMNDHQLKVATRIITSLTPDDYHQIQKATKEVVPTHIVRHVTNRVADLAKGIMHEQNDVARKKLITHLSVILAALAVSFVTAGLGAPAGLAALIGIFPYLSQEYKDFRTERKDVPLITHAS